MRTFKMIINPTKNKKDAAFCQYFKTNTADSKCMYNTANFYIRNTMTGLKKSPEESTHLETEVLHYVFTGIQKANEVIGQKNMKKKFAELNLSKVGGMNSAVIAFSIVSQEPFQYPTEEKWFLSYGTLDAIFKFTDNPVYRRMNSQVNQNAIRKAVAAWQGYFESLKAYKKNPAGFTGKPKIPGYKQDEEYIAWFSKQVAKLKEEDGRCYIQFVNNPDRFEIGKASLYSDLKYVKTEVKAMYGKYYILITFDDKIAEVEAPENPKRILGLDPGVNNFLGVANNFGGVPFVMNGRAVKSANQRFNKKRAKLISSVTKGSDSKSSVKYSKHLNILSQKRESFLRDYFYKCAWYICRYAKAAGVDPATGAQLYWVYDTDDEGNMINERVSSDYEKAAKSKYYLGSRIPDLYGSIGTDLSWKGVDLSILTTYSIGGKVYDGLYSASMNNMYYNNAWNEHALRRWQKPGDITDVPRIEIAGKSTTNDRFLVDASYFAIKNITLGYTLPKAWMQKVKLSSVRVFGSVDNLALFTHLQGMNPQYNFSGETSYSYSPNKTWSLGVEINF